MGSVSCLCRKVCREDDSTKINSALCANNLGRAHPAHKQDSNLLMKRALCWYHRPKALPVGVGA
jgi:hypothetical protein